MWARCTAAAAGRGEGGAFILLVTGWREQSLEIPEEVMRITLNGSGAKSSQSPSGEAAFVSMAMVSPSDWLPVNPPGLSGFKLLLVWWQSHDMFWLCTSSFPSSSVFILN